MIEIQPDIQLDLEAVKDGGKEGARKTSQAGDGTLALGMICLRPQSIVLIQ